MFMWQSPEVVKVIMTHVCQEQKRQECNVVTEPQRAQGGEVEV